MHKVCIIVFFLTTLPIWGQWRSITLADEWGDPTNVTAYTYDCEGRSVGRDSSLVHTTVFLQYQPHNNLLAVIIDAKELFGAVGYAFVNYRVTMEGTTSTGQSMWFAGEYQHGPSNMGKDVYYFKLSTAQSDFLLRNGRATYVLNCVAGAKSRFVVNEAIH